MNGSIWKGAVKLGLAALVLAGVSVAQAAVVNGTFDAAVPSNGTGGGWTTINIDGAGGWRSDLGGGNPSPFFVLNDAGQSGTDPTISQALTGLIAGGTYNVSGEFRTVHIGQNTGATQAFGVFLDSLTVFESPGITDTIFHSFSANFTATSSSMTLALAGERNGTDNDFGVDNIAVSLVRAPIVTPPGGAAPEPGTLLLIVGALLGFAGWQRRRS
jgi:hypothetical protein